MLGWMYIECIDEKNREKWYGDFGNLSSDYSAARQGFPAEVFDFLRSLISVDRPSILDVGCGTGIATRHLADMTSHVVGVDRDPEMIECALQVSTRITYIVAPAEQLPFGSQAFDAATAFSAFHWFANRQALAEIRRVLKPKGVFLIVNKNDVGDFKDGYKAALRPFIESDIPEAKKNYRPDDLLASAGFDHIEFRTFETIERFTADQAVAYLRSVSIWNLVPFTAKDAANAAIRKYCERLLDNGFVRRKIQVTAVSGQK